MPRAIRRRNSGAQFWRNSLTPPPSPPQPARARALGLPHHLHSRRHARARGGRHVVPALRRAALLPHLAEPERLLARLDAVLPVPRAAGAELVRQVRQGVRELRLDEPRVRDQLWRVHRVRPLHRDGRVRRHGHVPGPPVDGQHRVPDVPRHARVRAPLPLARGRGHARGRARGRRGGELQRKVPQVQKPPAFDPAQFAPKVQPHLRTPPTGTLAAGCGPTRAASARSRTSGSF